MTAQEVIERVLYDALVAQNGFVTSDRKVYMGSGGMVDVRGLASAVVTTAGLAVVKLPEPCDREPGDEFTDFPGVGLYVPVVFDGYPGEVQIRAGAWCDEPLSATEARDLAASLLAAANVAEAVAK